ncbi:hypothetical protein, partial [Methanospirillum sp.]|uniref:S8 family serine peptidase n=1 Tax=Methanospirillum sp. TaxID=45200 RepID=UPI002B54C99D
MLRQYIFIIILSFFLCIGFQAVMAVPGMEDSHPAVDKPPVVGAFAPFSPPTVVRPVSPALGPPIGHPATGIVQSPVMAGSSSGQVATHEAGIASNNTANASAQSREYAPDRVIVKFKTTGVAGASSLEQIQAEAHAALGATVIADAKTLGVEGMQVVSIPN